MWTLRFLIAFLLLASPIFAQKPKAPFSDPNDTDDPGQKLVYEGDREADETGSVLIVFDEPFSKTPSIDDISGDTVSGNRIHYIENANGETIAITIIIKPHGKVHYHCKGIKSEGIKREKD